MNQPILATILRSRVTCALISAAAFIQISLVSIGLPGWRSPFHAFLGIPDPGCGLTRAIVFLLRGEWQKALTYHAFAPLFVIALGTIGLATFLPNQRRDRLVAWIEGIENRTGLTAILLIGLVIYWLARLLIMRGDFLALVA
jgi:hypothetical protein